MKNLSILLRAGLGLLAMVALVGCDFDLDVPNTNDPDQSKALVTAEDMENLLGGTYLDVFQGQQYYCPALSLSTLGDECTSAWGNFGMRHLSSEPRVEWNNSITYDRDYQLVNRQPWYSMYSAISSTCDVLKAIDGGMVFLDADGVTDNTERGKAYGHFILGLAHGFLGLMFDQAFILDETIDLQTTTLDFSSYNDVTDKAVEELEKCITICEANTFTLPETWMHSAVDQDRLAEIAHSYIARYLVSEGRTVAERDAADWAAIKDHAEQGITEDLEIDCDGNYWWSGFHYIGQMEGWMRADYWSIGPADDSGHFDAWVATPVANRTYITIHTPDLRLYSNNAVDVIDHEGTDFGYKNPCPYSPTRGTYHFSYYFQDRYIEHANSGGASPVPVFLAAENDLILAEYYLRAGNAAQAATLINNTYVGRGGMTACSAANGIGTVNDDRDAFGTLWGILKYEKGIELWQTGVGTAWVDRRGWGDLVTNSPIHFPVPATELETLGLEGYTFGGGGAGSAPKMAPHIPARY